MTPNGLHHRLRTVVGQRTYRELSELTGLNAETVRRYVLGQPPSVDFVMSLCKSQGINPTWLLTGDGPMRASEVKSFALRDANAHELLAAVAFTLERLAERVGRLEVFLQTMETRLRARLPQSGTDGVATPQTPADSQPPPTAAQHIAGVIEVKPQEKVEKEGHE